MTDDRRDPRDDGLDDIEEKLETEAFDEVEGELDSEAFDDVDQVDEFDDSTEASGEPSGEQPEAAVEQASKRGRFRGLRSRGTSDEAADVADAGAAGAVSAARPGSAGGTRPAGMTPSEQAVHIRDRASAVFVVASVVIFALIIVYGTLFGAAGALTPVPTPAPIATASPAPTSASPAPTPTTGPITSPTAPASP
jgi:hypothetical protein